MIYTGAQPCVWNLSHHLHLLLEHMSHGWALALFTERCHRKSELFSIDLQINPAKGHLILGIKSCKRPNDIDIDVHVDYEFRTCMSTNTSNCRDYLTLLLIKLYWFPQTFLPKLINIHRNDLNIVSESAVKLHRHRYRWMCVGVW